MGSVVSLMRIIQNLGAVYSRKLTVQCTHLVTTEREVRRNSDKVRRAYNAYTCEIVSQDWLTDSYTAQKPLPEEGYAIPPEDETAGGIKATPGKKTGMKRILDEVLDDMADRPNKRRRTDSTPSATAGNGQVRVHPESLSHPGFSTYIDPSGNPWDALLVRSTAGGKSNHFYRLRLLIDPSRKRFLNEACWGRIGESAAQYRSDVQDRPTATAEFQRRFRSRTGGHWCFRFLDEPRPGKYRYIGQGSGDMEGMTRAKCSLPCAERMVMELIFQNQMPQATSRTPSSTVYKCRKLPLGTLGKDTLVEGYEALQKLADVIEMPSLARSRYAQSAEEVRVMLSSQYFSIIPHVFGRNKPPVISTPKQIRKELRLLDELADRAAQGDTESVPQNDHLHPLDVKFQSLGLQEFTRVTHTTDEYNHLARYFYQSAGSEAIQILHIYRLLRATETPRHPSSNTTTTTNRRLLWHGSRNPNLASILRHGLKIRPSGVAHNGASMGKGIYFSDSACVSINYSSAASSGLPSAFALGGTQQISPGMLLLCEPYKYNPTLQAKRLQSRRSRVLARRPVHP
ncbi:poly polymerase catalytic domain-containing protein [Aspergillus egyptiacus]|nr:poly polymerase catalytic domain-containing protein [Aspergillus egyptiacus]